MKNHKFRNSENGFVVAQGLFGVIICLLALVGVLFILDKCGIINFSIDVNSHKIKIEESNNINAQEKSSKNDEQDPENKSKDKNRNDEKDIENKSGNKNRNDVSQGTSTNITINTNASITTENRKDQDEEKAKKTSNNSVKEEKKEDSTPKYDPNSPNPVYSWTTEEKTKAPIKYNSVLIEYLEKQKNKLAQERFSIGVTSRKFAKELEKAKRNEKGCLAVLQRAAKIANEANKNNSWPVYFAYKTYTLEDFKLKFHELHQDYIYAQNNVMRLTGANDMMQQRLRVHNQDFKRFERQLNQCRQNLELIRSGNLTENIKNIIKNLDTAMMENSEKLAKTIEKAQENIYKPFENDKKEADLNFDDMIKKYAPAPQTKDFVVEVKL